jgi:hypothetical protein
LLQDSQKFTQMGIFGLKKNKPSGNPEGDQIGRIVAIWATV